MAYNVLDGVVDYSTTQHTEIVDAQTDQEIKGTKIIAGTLLTKDGREIVPPAITEIEGGSKNALITYQMNSKAKAEFNLTFDGKTLVTKDIRAQNFQGSGEKLTNLPTNQFDGVIPARFLEFGYGIKNVRNKLQVHPGPGITTDSEGVSVSLVSKGGLAFRNKRLVAEPKNCSSVGADGQNLSDDDLVMLHDTSRSEVRNTTLANLYSSYIHSKLPHSAGPINSLQLKAKNGFSASPNLTFEENVLNVDGKVTADALVVSGRTDFEGVVTRNIKTVSSKSYDIESADYTVLCDTSNNKIKVTLPPACDNKGRIVIIKKINTDKFKLKADLLTIDVEEGEIDFRKSVEIKFTYSTVTIQSDGKKWWIIGRTGT